MNSEDQLIDEIRRGNEAVLERIYLENRDVFLAFGKKLIQDTSLTEDIYQDAIIAFYQNVSTGKVIHLKSSIRTYILAIGKYMIFRHLRRSDSMVLFEELEKGNTDHAFYQYVDVIAEHDALVVDLEKALDRLGDPCRGLLKLVYYESKSNNEIMHILHYANTDVVKSKKYRCLQWKIR